MIEEWKDIPGYEGRYQASTLGKVYSLIRNRLLSPNITLARNNKCYFYVNLYDGSGAKGVKAFAVHRIIAATFLGKWSNRLLMVDHINGDSVDNRITNLRYATNSENCLNRNKITGVSFHKASGKWYVRITENQRRISIGLYTSKKLAFEARKAYVSKGAIL